MKTKSLLCFVTIVVGCAAIHARADSDQNDERQTRDSAHSHFFQRAMRPVVAARASQILGHEVVDNDGHKIGKVRELALDLQNGHIAAVIIGTGGFLGISEKDTAVPPAEFSWDPDSRKLVCRLDPEQLRNAPTFDMAQWSDNARPERVRAAYRRYGITTYFIDESVPTPVPTEVKPAEQLTSAGMAAPTVHLGPITRARDIIGEAVVDPQAEHVGKVENAIVEVNAGRIVALIVSTGDFLGMGNEVSAVPAQVFLAGHDQKTLRLDTTREELRTVPHLKPDQWQTLANPERVAMIYNAYNLPPYQNTLPADNTAQDVRDHSDNGSFVQGTSASDLAITDRIRQGIMSRSDLSADAENVRVITVNGQVTLRGPVKNQQEEQAIIGIARSAVAENAKVTNQIQTINQSPKSPNPPLNSDLK